MKLLSMAKSVGILVMFWAAGLSTAWAQGIPVYDNAQMINMIQAAIAQAKDYAAQVEQLETQAKMLESLTTGIDSSLNVNPTSAIQQGLSTVQQSGSAISGSSSGISSKLETVFGASGSTTVTDQAAVRKATEDTVRGAATLTGQQQDALPADAQRINNLAAQSQSATTALGAQQAGNQINAEIAQQLLQMRAKQLAQDQAANVTLEKQLQEEKQQSAVTSMFYGTK